MPRLPDEIPTSTLRLLIASGVGPATFRKLMERFDGDHDAAADASVAELRQLPRIGNAGADALRKSLDEADPDAERRAMAEHGASLVIIGDPDYPILLSSIHDPPPALWIRGRLIEEDRLAIAIVGSRDCSAYGLEQAARFSQNLAQAGLTIISGGARGIDGEAHRAALRVRGRTIAVLGSGIGRAYPPEHAQLFDSIVEQGGAVVSEQPTLTEAQARFFPSRNRIISGMSLGVLVVEAARRSGALITARLAAEEHHREVMALPGRIDSPASAGALRAIRDGWAALVLDHADVLQQLESALPLLKGAILDAPATASAPAPPPVTLFEGGLSEPQQRIVAALQPGPKVPDQISAATGLPLSDVLSELTLLQIRGLLRKEGATFACRQLVS